MVTHGWLLAKLTDPEELKEIDYLVIDEAHERGIESDEVIGSVKLVLQKTPEAKHRVKLIIMSATANTAQFKDHFSDFKCEHYHTSVPNVFEKTRYFLQPDEFEVPAVHSA